MKLPHWASILSTGLGALALGYSGVYPQYGIVLKALGGFLIATGSTGLLSLPSAGPLAALFAKKPAQPSAQP